MDRGYESILKVINDKTDKKKQGNDKKLDYYEAVRIAYTDSESMQEYIDSSLKESLKGNQEKIQMNGSPHIG